MPRRRGPRRPGGASARRERRKKFGAAIAAVLQLRWVLPRLALGVAVLVALYVLAIAPIVYRSVHLPHALRIDDGGPRVA